MLSPLRLASLLALVSGIVATAPSHEIPLNAPAPAPAHNEHARASSSAVLRDFQVYPPVLTPTTNGLALTNGSSPSPDEGTTTSSSNACVATTTLVNHVFANSYGKPFVGTYTPPACKFNRVTLDLTVTSAGRQFDRLALMYLGDVEIWRTSTAEPTPDGIVWTYIKDASQFVALFNEPQKVIFDLGNLINSNYTAPFNVVVTATFFSATDTVEPANSILPISAMQASANMGSAWQVPTQNASSSLTLPRNVRRAVVSIAACGQQAEEFWYTNVLNSDTDTFGSAVAYYGFGPWREVQLFIDGQLAGVVWPFPVIFTGGVVPGFWRPIVGIDAFDLREDEIDITPWLPILCDGKAHEFGIKVAGIADDGHNHGSVSEEVGSYWVVSGKVFLFLDKHGSVTTGSKPSVDGAGPPSISISSSVQKLKNGKNSTLTTDVRVTRQLRVTSNVTTSNGTEPAVWTQSLSYSNHDEITNEGVTQAVTQLTTGNDVASTGYARRIAYPITVNSTITEFKSGALSITGDLTRGQTIDWLGRPVFPTGLQSFDQLSSVRAAGYQGARLQTAQNGSASYKATPANAVAYSFGATQQDMTFYGLMLDSSGSSPSSAASMNPAIRGSAELYTRHVVAVNSTVVTDMERLVGRPVAGGFQGVQAPEVSSSAPLLAVAAVPVQSVLGHSVSEGGSNGAAVS